MHFVFTMQVSFLNFLQIYQVIIKKNSMFVFLYLFKHSLLVIISGVYTSYGHTYFHQMTKNLTNLVSAV